MANAKTAYAISRLAAEATKNEQGIISKASSIEIIYLEGINLENSEIKNFPIEIQNRLKEEQNNNPMYYKLIANGENSSYNYSNSGKINDNFEMSCGAKSHRTFISGWNKPKFILVESKYFNSPILLLSTISFIF